MPQIKKHLFIILLLLTLNSKGQLYTDCFKAIKDKMELDLQNQHAPDTVNISLEYFKTLIGCKFPYAPVKTWDNKDINPVTCKTDFVIINFNYLYCDYCIGQLDYFLKLKKESKKSITIISFFKNSTEDIQHLIDKYKNDIYIVSEAKTWMEAYDLNGGYSLTYILDKNKQVNYARSFGSYEYTSFYDGLKNIINK
jgi:hypothetical protein